MNRPISENDPFIVGTMAAMRRAARRARQIARDTHTPLVVVRNGKVVQIMLTKKTRVNSGRGRRSIP
jgi:hypothetical protein